MTGSIFKDILRANWKQLLYWGIGVGILGFYVVFIASDSDLLEQYGVLLTSLPPALLSAFGISDARLFTTAEGFISSAYVTYAMLILSVYGVTVGLNITSNNEDSGILDTLLALPIKRSQVMIETYLAYAVISLGIVILCLILPMIAIGIFPIDVDMGKVVLGVLSIYPGLLLLSAVTCLFTVLVKERALAIGLTVGFVIISYFVNFLGNAATDSIAVIVQQLSFFYHTDGHAIMTDSYSPLIPAVILTVALACMAFAVNRFDQRDINV